MKRTTDSEIKNKIKETWGRGIRVTEMGREEERVEQKGLKRKAAEMRMEMTERRRGKRAMR